jgi:hypothetical protein
MKADKAMKAKEPSCRELGWENDRVPKPDLK